MKTKTLIIISVVIIVLAVAVWIYAASRKGSLMATVAPDGTGTKPASDGTTTATESVKMPLVQGSTGTAAKSLIKSLQTALNKKYNAGLTVDGVWGKLTTKALQANKLPITIYWKQWSEITGIALSSNGTVSIPSVLPVWNNPLTWF